MNGDAMEIDDAKIMELLRSDPKSARLIETVRRHAAQILASESRRANRVKRAVELAERAQTRAERTAELNAANGVIESQKSAYAALKKSSEAAEAASAKALADVVSQLKAAKDQLEKQRKAATDERELTSEAMKKLGASERARESLERQLAASRSDRNEIASKLSQAESDLTRLRLAAASPAQTKIADPDVAARKEKGSILREAEVVKSEPAAQEEEDEDEN